ncbi:MAG: CBS domain-containing protein [Gammaproteobacteria bacterium]|nr:CBS domain-containing protein [Gammaproteobacteria bacterium]
MTAKNIMSNEVYSIPPELTVSEAVLIMAKNKVHNLPVVNQDGSFIGLFSLRRLTRALMPMAAQIGEDIMDFQMAFIGDDSDDYLRRLKKMGEQPVCELLEKKKKLRCCSPNTPIPHLLQLLSENPMTLPVLVLKEEKHQVVGMVSTWDVLTKIALSLYDNPTQEENVDATS